ncbi:terminase [Citrobacter sp. Cpo150]|uniref:terminase n=1 Tax=Citrobacter sp. Cpo150 TaxID=2985154 RepID=UPI0025781A10|nr:terminase [Citrobacter sp. Cpo150]MBY5093864.1 terminase [Citrobacter freundii]MDM2762568.1 terminase [Citrobacter sp. Cpo150]
MAKTDWKKLEQEFQRAHAKSGVKLQDWCEQKGINYATARRYIKMRRSAQADAQKKVRKNAQSTSEESGADAGENEDAHSTDDDENCADQPETKRIRGSRSLAPTNAFQERNTAAVKHRGYAKYLDADGLLDDASEMALIDELVFTRARALSVTSTMKRMFSDMEQAETVELRVELYGKILQAEQALDRNIGRIESIERTLSTLDVYAATTPKIIADTARIKAATAKLKAETDILTSNKRGVTTPMTSIVADLQAMHNSGRINDFPEE